MDIKQAKEDIRRTFLAYTERSADGLLRIPTVRQRPVLLMGPPGLGKTAIVWQLAQELGAGFVEVLASTQGITCRLVDLTASRDGEIVRAQDAADFVADLRVNADRAHDGVLKL